MRTHGPMLSVQDTRGRWWPGYGAAVWRNLSPNALRLRLFFCLEARKEIAMMAERYAPRHSISIRMPRPIWDWLVVRGDAEGMAPSTCGGSH